MSAKHQSLEREDECLQSQDQGVHKRQRIHDMERNSPKGTCILRNNFVVVVGISIGNAAAAWRHALEPTLEKGLEENKKRTRLFHLLRIDQLLTTPELAGGNLVLHICHHHRDDGEWL